MINAAVQFLVLLHYSGIISAGLCMTLVLFPILGYQNAGSNQKIIQIVQFVVIIALTLVFALAVAVLYVITTQQGAEIQALRANASIQRRELDRLQHNTSTTEDEIAALYSKVSYLEDKLDNITGSGQSSTMEVFGGTYQQLWDMLASLISVSTIEATHQLTSSLIALNNSLQEAETQLEEKIDELSSSIRAMNYSLTFTVGRLEETIDQHSSFIEALSAEVTHLWNETSELAVNVEERDEHLHILITRVENDFRSETQRYLFNVTSEIHREVQEAITQHVYQLSFKIEDTERRLNHSIDDLRKSISSAAPQLALPATVLVALVSFYHAMLF